MEMIISKFSLSKIMLLNNCFPPLQLRSIYKLLLQKIPSLTTLCIRENGSLQIFENEKVY